MITPKMCGASESAELSWHRLERSNCHDPLLTAQEIAEFAQQSTNAPGVGCIKLEGWFPAPQTGSVGVNSRRCMAMVNPRESPAIQIRLMLTSAGSRMTQ